MLRLNEDLVEAIALAHDLGHTPFGHAGQDALHACMAGHGGFEHNLQSLRVVDRLEQRYPAFDGLNLSFETREGILKHCSRRHAEALEPRRARRRGAPLPRRHAAQPGGAAVSTWPTRSPTTRTTSTTACARACSTPASWPALAAGSAASATRCWPSPGPGHARTAAAVRDLRRMLSAQVHDCVDATAQALHAARRPRRCGAPGCRRWPPAAGAPGRVHELKRFLFQPRSTGTRRWCRPPTRRGRWWPSCSRPMCGPARDAGRLRRPTTGHRAVADYIAGMTDRFALREYHRLTGEAPFPGGAVGPAAWSPA
jgi:dGTPase